jgi:hypothetical protein
MVLAAHAAEKPLELAAAAPQRHVVVRGDTLWGISAKFLKDPFRWNELWRLNADEVKNPHRIYPGQVLVLDLSGDTPALRIEAAGNIPTVKLEPKVRVSEQTAEISAIPQQVIEPFLSQPLVVEQDALEGAPRIVATENNRVYSAQGDLLYVDKIAAGAAPLWQVYRPGKEIKDPATDEVIGYEAVLLGTARLVQAGSPATVKIQTVREEIGKDDRLIAAPRPDIINYPLHRPKEGVESRVVSIYGGSTAGGRYSIIAITGGQKGGIELGHVLALSRKGQTVTDRYAGKKQEITLPDERYGLAYVFRTFPKVAYALVMQTAQAVEVGDRVGTP